MGKQDQPRYGISCVIPAKGSVEKVVSGERQMSTSAEGKAEIGTCGHVPITLGEVFQQTRKRE